MSSDGSITAPSLSDSIMGATSVLTDSLLRCVTATAFVSVYTRMSVYGGSEWQ